MAQENRTLFLLGAGGFIGSCTAQEALRQGWQVVAVARDPEKISEARCTVDPTAIASSTRLPTAKAPTMP